MHHIHLQKNLKISGEAQTPTVSRPPTPSRPSATRPVAHISERGYADGSANCNSSTCSSGGIIGPWRVQPRLKSWGDQGLGPNTGALAPRPRPKAGLGVGCRRGSSRPAVRVRGGITPGKFIKPLMLNPAFWWLLATSDENSVCPPVCPPVCQTRALWVPPGAVCSCHS